MSVRDLLNKSPAATIAGVVAAVAIGIVSVVYLSGRASTDTVTLLSQAYYSSDNGQTWFADDIKKLVPFDQGGKTAYRVYVFKCGNGKPFAGYLQRPSESARAEVAKLSAKPDTDPTKDPAIKQLMATQSEVTKPGGAAWVPLASREGSDVVTLRCPDGSKGPPEPVFP